MSHKPKHKSKHGICCLCQRETDLTFHHLIPRKVHRRAYFKKNFSKQKLNDGIHVCRQCHRVVHKSYTEMELAKKFNSADTLTADPFLVKPFEWLSKQKIKA